MKDFSEIPPSRWVASNALAFAFEDGFPVTEGHTLVVTRRVVATWFDATREEQLAVLDLIDEVKRLLDRKHRPAGYNVGFNAGPAAGQTVMHLHVHVIPRYDGDMDDPRGGVRHVIPSRGNYKLGAFRPPAQHLPALLTTGGEENPFWPHLLPLLRQATEVAIVAAFVKDSGLLLLQAQVRNALRRGARIRLITGDYLRLTQVEALHRLLGWMNPDSSEEAEPTPPPGTIEVRVIEVDDRAGAAPAAKGAGEKKIQVFHPKSWRLEGPDFAVAYVGSSNLSRSALLHGVEWNLRAERAQSPEAYGRIAGEFEALWRRARPLDAAWVEAYARRVASQPASPALFDEEGEEGPAQVREPHRLQREALERLREGRGQGWSRALVVMATGLGKTWLAAFDVRQFAEELERPPRVLFLAHRGPLLWQAARTFRPMLEALLKRPPRIGWFSGDLDDLDGDLVVASVQKLSRQEHLRRLAADSFDYVIVDEVHHATAKTYLGILQGLRPRFLLGLTATPDRMDEADVLSIFDDHEAYRADVGVGILHGLLVPFAYHGIKDTVSYDQVNIPWRGRRFDPKVLAEAVQTQERMKQVYRAWEAHPGERTLIFCASIGHADFVQGWLAAKGHRVACVHAEAEADVNRVLADLEALRLDAVCAVDMLNEGIDVPEIDRVILLRPSESPVVLLQQIGRGLRRAPGKGLLTIIDFVGNHRFFLDRVQRIIDLGQRRVSVSGFLDRRQDPILPPGCSIHLEEEAKDILRRLLPRSGRSEAISIYREVCAARSKRLTAREFYHLGFSLREVHERADAGRLGWFDFVLAEDRQAAGGHLGEDERRALAHPGALEWLRVLERTQLTKCYKAVLLQALAEADALGSGMELDALAKASLKVLRSSPDLEKEIDSAKKLAKMDRDAPGKEWLSYWEENPINALAINNADTKVYFAVEGERFICRLPIAPGAEAAFTALTKELIEYRLADYRDRPVRTVRPRSGAQEGGMEPIGGKLIRLPLPARLRTYPDLRAAARVLGRPDEAQDPDGQRTGDAWLPAKEEGAALFAVRASGISMEGGKEPIRDGDWLVMRALAGAELGALEGKIALLQVPDEKDGHAYWVKRVVRAADRWLLRSENPAVAPVPLREGTRPVAELLEVIRPEQLAPEVGTLLGGENLDAAFLVPAAPIKTGRVGGHLFILVQDQALLADSLRRPGVRPQEGETAFVLVKEEGGWRYLGVARRSEDGFALPGAGEG